MDLLLSDDDLLWSFDGDDPLLSGGALITAGSLVEPRIDEVLTQYRESPKLLGVLRAYLGKLEGIASTLASMFDYFDLDTAVGDQLTIIGRILGFPRCHCVCEIGPVIGYLTGHDGTYSGPYDLAGYCEPASSFVNCTPLGNSMLCVSDDEAYRAILKARRYQMLGLYDIESLGEAIQTIWGPTAQITDSTVGEVVVTPGRALTDYETSLLQIVFRALPIAPGIKAMIHFGLGPIAGYGEGWGGYCSGEILCPVDPHTYTCA